MENLELRLEALTTPRLRWWWLAAAAVAWALMVWVMLSLVLPPLGNVPLKSVVIMVLTFIWLPSLLLFIASIVGLDEHQHPSRTPLVNQPTSDAETH